MGVSLVIGVILAAAYAYKTRYNPGFVRTLAILPAVVCAVIMMVNGNVGTGVAVAGAFSLVRFRSVPGSAKDIGAIFSKEDLTLNGSGSMTVTSAGHGIVSKDDLVVIGGTYEITAEKQGVSGKDSVRIADGTFTIESGKDAIHSENSEDESKGFVYLADGTYTLKADGDGISASGVLQIDGGTYEITAGGGNTKATKRMICRDLAEIRSGRSGNVGYGSHRRMREQ